MPAEKIFKINKYIVLKLEGEKVNIYVNGKIFRQCKSLRVQRFSFSRKAWAESDVIPIPIPITENEYYDEVKPVCTMLYYF